MGQAWVESGIYVRAHVSERFFIEVRTIGGVPKEAMITACKWDEDGMRCVSELVNLPELEDVAKAITEFVERASKYMG